MLHAVIRTKRDAFHVFSEVNAYNLQTLRLHVRHGFKEHGSVHLRVEIDPGDQRMFKRYMERWLPALANSGVVVEVDVVRQRPEASAAGVVVPGRPDRLTRLGEVPVLKP